MNDIKRKPTKATDFIWKKGACTPPTLYIFIFSASKAYKQKRGEEVDFLWIYFTQKNLLLDSIFKICFWTVSSKFAFGQYLWGGKGPTIRNNQQSWTLFTLTALWSATTDNIWGGKLLSCEKVVWWFIWSKSNLGGGVSSKNVYILNSCV